MNRPLILCIETALAACSVALCEGDRTLAQLTITEKNKAAEQLHPMINDVMKMAALGWEELSAVALSGGPGSYTGLRIGASAAKGICFAAGIPLIHVETMQALHAAVKSRMGRDANTYIAIMDARRNDAFIAVMDRDGNYISQPAAVTLIPDMFARYALEGKCILMGDGVKKYVNNHALDFQEIEISSIQACDLAGKALKSYQNNDFEDIAYYEPKYYKEAYLTKK